MKDRKILHEKYHKTTKSQYRIITDNNFTYRLILSVINKYIKPDMKVLDIGCGAGTVDFYLAHKGFHVSGADISEKAIKSCLSTARNLKIKNVEFKRVSFPKEKINGKYDFIIFSEVIEHLEHDSLAIKEINKLLKPGGILFLSTPSKNAPLYRLGLTKKFDMEVGHLRRYSIQDLSKILKANKFKLLEVDQTEGILRNFLFVNSSAGTLLKYVKFFVSDIITVIDTSLLKLLGESNIIIVASKK